MILFAISEGTWTAIITIAAIGIVLAISYSLANRRAAALQNAAAAMRFSFERKGEALRNELNSSLNLLRSGRNPTAYNVMRGPGDVALFDFEYTVGADRSARTIGQTVAAYRFPGALMPEFHLCGEDFFHRAASAFGYKPIGFDTHPDFSKRFLLRGSDENAIRSFFQPALLDFFRTLPEKPAWNIEAAGPWLIIYRAKKKTKPAELSSFAQRTDEIAREINLAAGISNAAQSNSGLRNDASKYAAS
ncbi:MAG TPA: hypothetical protein VFO34_02205 [Candidatus Acidoferrales bacterium]|nr:hypothetical protein [Candidatus Acidoferrales bacterium]